MAYREDSYYIEKILGSDDRKAFEHLVRKHQDMVYNIGVRLTRNQEDAEEITQDTFIKVYESLKSYRGDSKFTTWLYRIAWNMAAGKNRRLKLVSGSTDDDNYVDTHEDESMDLDNMMNHQDHKKWLRNAIDSLSSEAGTIITLFYMDSQSIEEISDITGLSKSNVKVRLHRARKNIESYLRTNLNDELNTLVS